MNQSETPLKFTVTELEIMQGLFNQQGSVAGIKDMRIIDKVVKKLRSITPEKPPQPQMGKPESDKAEEVAELRNKYREEIQAWQKQLQELNDQEVEVELTSTDKNVIAQRFNQAQFHTNDHIRDKVIVLADKLGI